MLRFVPYIFQPKVKCSKTIPIPFQTIPKVFPFHFHSIPAIFQYSPSNLGS